MISAEMLRTEVLHSIKALGEKDCDLKTITICCNPNYIRGSDKDLKPLIQKALDDFVLADVLFIKKSQIQVRNGTKRIKTILVYSLKNM